MIRQLLVCGVLAAVAACSQPAGPPLDVSGLEVYAPLPGSTAGVAYLTLQNNTGASIEVRRIDSPDFESVQLHESLLEDGVYRMNRIGALTIESGRSVTLKEGGKHVMLMNPRSGLEIGTPVTLLLHFDDDGEIVLRATLQSRIRLETN